MGVNGSTLKSWLSSDSSMCRSTSMYSEIGGVLSFRATSVLEWETGEVIIRLGEESRLLLALVMLLVSSGLLASRLSRCRSEWNPRPSRSDAQHSY